MTKIWKQQYRPSQHRKNLNQGEIKFFFTQTLWLFNGVSCPSQNLPNESRRNSQRTALLTFSVPPTAGPIT